MRVRLEEGVVEVWGEKVKKKAFQESFQNEDEIAILQTNKYQKSLLPKDFLWRNQEENDLRRRVWVAKNEFQEQK